MQLGISLDFFRLADVERKQIITMTTYAAASNSMLIVSHRNEAKYRENAELWVSCALKNSL